jgi:hypothetical protein
MGSEMVRKKIEPGTAVSVTFSDRERVLVLEHTLAGPDVTDSLETARGVDGRFSVQYTLEDLDELLGYIAAEANHSKSTKLQRELDALHERLQGVMESFDDGQWQTAF